MSKKSKKKQKKHRNAARAKAEDRKNCPHCGNGEETFRYMDRLWRFDVDLARQCVNDGREVVELEPDDVKFSVEVCRIYPQHVKHVNPVYPGIIAHIWYPEPDGNVAHGHLLIDGHHRAARCLELERPYYVHILTEEESRAVMIDGPDVASILEQLKGEPVAMSN